MAISVAYEILLYVWLSSERVTRITVLTRGMFLLNVPCVVGSAWARRKRLATRC